MDENERKPAAPATLLGPAEIADLEARRDDGPLPEHRRAVRHGTGDLARQAEALAQSRLFDDLATAAVQRRARLRGARSRLDDSQVDDSQVASRLADGSAAGDLAQYRREGLISLAGIRARSQD